MSRRKALEGEALLAARRRGSRSLYVGARIRLERLGSAEPKAVCKRGWRGKVSGKLDDGRLQVCFDRNPDAVVVCDPAVDELRNIDTEEQNKARFYALRKLKLGPGDVLELTADIEGEKRLRAGMRATVEHIHREDCGISVDWHGVQMPHKLFPTDAIRVVERSSEPRFDIVALKRNVNYL
jgi:hypothetical protein